MLVLALTASTAKASVGLFSEQKCLVERSHFDSRKHNEFLNQALEDCLHEAGVSWAQIDVIAVDIGPGSFTGLRVAVNIARALGFSLNKPVFTATSLEILLDDASIQNPNQTIALINAYKNMVFYSWKDEETGLIKTPSAIAAEDFEQMYFVNNPRAKRPSPCVGDGFQTYSHIWTSNLTLAQPDCLHPNIAALASLAAQHPERWLKDWKLVIPLYIRASAAEENQHRG
jgi:tRNA threonylcarbamoyl adenosine modification protein YeaZ